MACSKYHVTIVLVGLAILMPIGIVIVQRENLIFVRNILPVPGTSTRKELMDVGASPVFSALSTLERSLQHKGFPEIVELDYEPIVLKEEMTPIDMQDAIIALSLQRQIVCRNWEMYGTMNGDWPVCTAAALIPKKPCTVYSFGIKYDWSFDDTYRDAHGCTLRTFDPSMGKTKEHEHKPGVFFYPVGLSDKKGRERLKFLDGKWYKWDMDTYAGLLKRFGEEDTIIPYLKFDIETMEWKVLENLLASGKLKNVVQLSFELHVDHLKNVKKYFHSLKALEALGFRRWFYHHRLNGLPFQCDQSYININYLNRTT